MLKQFDLILSVKRGRFRVDDSNVSVSTEVFKSIRQEILIRDNYTCKYCGFRALLFQEVHHLDDNHDNNDPENLITACVLCHMVNHIGFAGHRNRGTLIYMDPAAGMKQSELNQLVRTLWVAEASDDKSIKVQALTYLSRLYKMAANAKRILGTSSPSALGDYLLALPEDKYAQRAEALAGVYLLPTKEGYKAQIDYWVGKTYASIPPAKWGNIAAQFHTKVARLGEGDD